MSKETKTTIMQCAVDALRAIGLLAWLLVIVFKILPPLKTFYWEYFRGHLETGGMYTGHMIIITAVPVAFYLVLSFWFKKCCYFFADDIEARLEYKMFKEKGI